MTHIILSRMTAKTNTNVHPIDRHGGPVERNAGMEFNPDLFGKIRINRSAVERRAATIGTRRTVKKAYQAAWLLKAVTCIDLTTLAGDDTPGTVRRLCQKARRPVRHDLLQSAGRQRPEYPHGRCLRLPQPDRNCGGGTAGHGHSGGGGLDRFSGRPDPDGHETGADQGVGGGRCFRNRYRHKPGQGC